MDKQITYFCNMFPSADPAVVCMILEQFTPWRPSHEDNVVAMLSEMTGHAPVTAPRALPSLYAPDPAIEKKRKEDAEKEEWRRAEEATRQYVEAESAAMKKDEKFCVQANRFLATMQQSPLPQIAPTQLTFSKGKAMGKGAVGIVRAAVMDGRPEPVAVKCICLTDELRSAQRELMAASSVKHHNIVNCFAFAVDSVNDDLFIAMEKGMCNLTQYTLDSDEPKLMQLAENVFAGLHAMEIAKFSHGDVKPENILVFREGAGVTFKLCDFHTSILHTSVNQTAPMITMAYAAPELLQKG